MNDKLFYCTVAAIFVAVVAVSVSLLGWYGIILDCIAVAGLHDGATRYASQDDSQTGDR